MTPEEQFKALEEAFKAQISAAAAKRDQLKIDCASLQEIINVKKQAAKWTQTIEKLWNLNNQPRNWTMNDNKGKQQDRQTRR